jgi:methyl-accepting chemotaxis protein
MFKSLRGKTVAIVIVSVLVMAIVMGGIFIPKQIAITSDVIEDYMIDVAVLAGESIDSAKELHGDSVLEPKVLRNLVASINVRDFPSSYCYVVNADGTILYHPDTDRIGAPVENEVIRSVTADIKAGLHPMPEYKETSYQGTKKVVTYYVSESSDFVLVLTADKAEVQNITGRNLLRSILSCVGIIIVILALAILLIAKMMRPISIINFSIQKLAKLDFRKNRALDNYTSLNDECGGMSRSVLELTDKLQGISNELSEAIKHLYDASGDMTVGAVNSSESVGQVEKAISEISDGASSQAGESQTAMDNVAIMGEMIQETTREVESLRANAADMDQAGSQAMTILNKLSEINNKTRESVETIYQQTNATNASVNEIRSAVEMITGIAEQTNLLSLNASIEAARAGEAGRGFAVVASEIQKLAEQSNRSANEIEKIIENLSAESSRSVAIMDDVKVIIDTQNKDVNETEKAFHLVKDDIEQSIQSIELIAEKTQNLNEARERVIDVVHNLTSIAQENAASTQETLANATRVNDAIGNVERQAEDLKEIADNLTKTIGKITL